MTQRELAERLMISDKTVSKWERAKGYPDISLLEPLAKVFHISVSELLAGQIQTNRNPSANILNSVFYVCPVCGNTIHAMGELALSCHGVPLLKEVAESSDESHKVLIERSEDEYFIQIDHPMTKQHHLTFIAAMAYDGLQLKKLYPQQAAQARFRINGVKRIYCHCNIDGLYYFDIDPRVPNSNHC